MNGNRWWILMQTARRTLRERLETVRSALAHRLAGEDAEGAAWLEEYGDGLELRITGRKIDPEEIREILNGTGGET